jgi:hypothetical protein
VVIKVRDENDSPAVLIARRPNLTNAVSGDPEYIGAGCGNRVVKGVDFAATVVLYNSKTLIDLQSQNAKGSLAQLVQSICLTSRGSGVRTPQLPL